MIYFKTCLVYNSQNQAVFNSRSDSVTSTTAAAAAEGEAVEFEGGLNAAEVPPTAPTSSSLLKTGFTSPPAPAVAPPPLAAVTVVSVS